MGMNQNWGTVTDAADASPQYTPGPPLSTPAAVGSSGSASHLKGLLAPLSLRLSPRSTKFALLLAGEPASIRVNALSGATLSQCGVGAEESTTQLPHPGWNNSMAYLTQFLR